MFQVKETVENGCLDWEKTPDCMEWLCPHEKKHNEHVIWRLYSLCEEIRGQFQTTIGFKIKSVLAVTFIFFNYHQTVRNIFLLYLGILLIHMDIQRERIFSWVTRRIWASFFTAWGLWPLWQTEYFFEYAVPISLHVKIALCTPPGHPQLPLVPSLDSKLIVFFFFKIFIFRSQILWWIYSIDHFHLFQSRSVSWGSRWQRSFNSKTIIYVFLSFPVN